MEWLVNGANILYLASYFVRDILVLRTLTVVGAAALIPYFWLQPDPLMGPVYWNLLFIAINLYRICRRNRQERTARLPLPCEGHQVQVTSRAQICLDC